MLDSRTIGSGFRSSVVTTIRSRGVVVGVGVNINALAFDFMIIRAILATLYRDLS